MKNSNLLQALMAGGIAIGIALGGAGLGIALDNKKIKNNKTTQIVGPQGLAGNTGPRGPKGEKGNPGQPGKDGALGPRGPTGPKGDRGPQGNPGQPGKDGKNGDTGLAGKDGQRGPEGPKGDQGDTGSQGNPGQPGKDGALGPIGPTGPKGDRGPQGNPGQPGKDGKNGDTGLAGKDGQRGSAGPKGDIGPQGPAGPKGEKGDQGDKGDNANSHGCLFLAKIMELKNKENYYDGMPVDTGGTATSQAASKFFSDYLKTFNSNFNNKKELVIAATAPENDVAFNKASLFGEKKTFMDEMFLILTTKTTLDIKQSFVDNGLTEYWKKLIHVTVRNYGQFRYFISGFRLTITAPPETTKGLAQQTKRVEWIIMRDWTKTGAAAEKYNIISVSPSATVLNSTGFTALKAKLGLAIGEEHADWKIIATKAGARATANVDGSDVTTAVGVNKKTGQVAYYIAPGALLGSTNPTKIKIDSTKPATLES